MSLPPTLADLFQPYTPTSPLDRPTGERKIVQRLLAAQGNRCSVCGGAMSLVRSCKSHRAATVDHVRPRALGGKSRNNRLLAHRRCNEAKAHRAPRACELLLLSVVNLWAARLEEPTPPPTRERKA